MTIRARVIVASNRAAAGVYEDTSGPLLVAGCGSSAARSTRRRSWSRTANRSARRCEAAIADGVDVVVTSGGTGITPTDRTPDVTRALLDYEIPGIAEAIRAYSRDEVPDRGAVPRAGPAWPAARWSSTCPARPAARGTAWPCSGRSSPTPSTSSAAATTAPAPGVRLGP